MRIKALNEKIGALSQFLSSYSLAGIQVLCGSLFLALMAQLTIPAVPVPVSMQTLGVALLAIALGPKKGALAVLAYLTEASMGLPVLAGGTVNPLWMVAPRAGYLIGFLLSAYVVGSYLEKGNGSFVKNWAILSFNEVIILNLGSLWLALFVGWENAFVLGTAPFIPGAVLKTTIAACSIKPIEWIKGR